MAKNSCTLSLQDFIPYPVQVLPLREFLPRDNKLINNQNANNNRSSTACPFDCCQKQFQNQYFPNCELTNAPLRMKIGSAGDRHNKVSGIPCLERRPIYEGRVTEMPMRFEDLLKESSNSNVNVASNNNPHDHGQLLISEAHHQQQYPTDTSDRLKLTFHKGGSKGISTVDDKLKNFSGVMDQYKYFWDNESAGWRFKNVEASTSTRSSYPLDNLRVGANFSDTFCPDEDWRGYYDDQQDKRGGQLKAIAVQQLLQEHQRQVTRSENIQMATGDTKSEVTKVKNDFIEQQLSNHLKSFKYVKPSSPAVNQIGFTNNQADANYKSLNSQSKPNFKPKHQEILKRALSPRQALEQYERLRKYWNYQHQLLGTSMVPYHLEQFHQPDYSKHSQEVADYNYHNYGNQWTSGYPAGVSSLIANSTVLSSAASAAESQQQYKPIGTRHGTWDRGYNRSNDNQTSSFHQRSQKTMDKSLEQIGSKPRATSDIQVSPEESREAKDEHISDDSNEPVINSSPSDGTVSDPNVPKPRTPVMSMEVEDTPKDLSLGRRHSDQQVTPPRSSPEQRSVSIGPIDEYDHIVLLDKRVKSYMCKRCFETLKSEQEIRNHLFCKMLNNTVQCHICRNLLRTEEYTDHLQLHAVKNQ